MPFSSQLGLTAQRQARFPLGVFAGNPDTSSSSNEAAFVAQFNSFTSLMRVKPRFMNSFINEGDAMSTWASGEDFTSLSWKNSAVAHNLIPVIGLPMVNSGNASAADQIFQDIAAGSWDTTWASIITKWSANGFNNIYVRIGYEFNGSFMPWYCGNDGTARQTHWIAAFQRIATIVKSHGAKVVWNPNMQIGGATITAVYPGDSYVDVIGIDAYNPLDPFDFYSWSRNNGTFDPNFATWAADPINRAHFWTYQTGSQGNPTGTGQYCVSVQSAIDIAKAHGKSVAMPEGGAGANSSDGVPDDGTYPQWLASMFGQANGAKVEFINIWDILQPDHNWAFTGTTTSRPLEAAAWKQYFGV